MFYAIITVTKIRKKNLENPQTRRNISDISDISDISGMIVDASVQRFQLPVVSPFANKRKSNTKNRYAGDVHLISTGEGPSRPKPQR